MIKNYLKSIFQNTKLISEASYAFVKDRLIFNIPVGPNSVWKFVTSEKIVDENQKPITDPRTNPNREVRQLITAFVPRQK